MTQLRCGTCGHVGAAAEIACTSPLVCHHFALRQIEGKLPADAPAIPPMIHLVANRAVTEEDYDKLRVQLDEAGIKAMDVLIGKGMDAKAAGERITEFNDTVIAAARRRYGVAK